MDGSEPASELLLTRLNPPSAGPGIILRRRLTGLLQQAGQYSLALIVAPAGAGKSCLLADWVNSAHFPAAWLSLEPEDNDPARFWRYFTAALQAALPGARLPAPLIVPQMGAQALPGSLDQLCNVLAVQAQPVFLVLDDAQNVDNREIYTSLAYLLDHQPANFHLVMASRSLPPLPLARLRAKNRLLELRPPDLNFDRDETALFLQANRVAAPGDDLVEKVAGLTQGWAAGLRLMAIALAGQGGGLDAWLEGGKLAVEYLAAEIIDRLPGRWAVFLQSAAVFEHFTPEMAAALSGDPEPSMILDQIMAAGLFIHRQGESYRLHPFFRQALWQKQTEAERQRLNAAAAAWLETHARPEEAVTQALAAEDWQAAIRLVLLLAEGKFQDAEIRTLESWIEAIPAEQRARFPDVQVLLGWIYYMAGQVPQARRLVDELEKSDDRLDLSHKGWLLGLRCQLALVAEQNRQALELARLALAEMGEADLFMRGLLCYSLAMAQQALGDPIGCLDSYRQALQVNKQSKNRFMSLITLVGLGLELDNQGKRLSALALCDEALDEIAGTPDEGNPVYGMIALLQARLLWEAYRLDEAERLLEQAAEKLERLGIPGMQIAADLVRCEILASREEYGEALRLVNINRRRTRSSETVGYRRLFDALRAEIALKTGNLAAVHDWLENAGLPAAPQEDPARELEFVVAARYLVETGALDEAARLLDALELFAKRAQRLRIAVIAWLTRATLAWKKGELGLVKLSLEGALALAAPQGYTSLLLDYAGLLLGVLAHLPGAPAEVRARFTSAMPAESGGLIEMLTARELDVLRLLADNLTNAEIARQLVLSNETVKVHVKHIFQKLAVGDRRQAVRRGRELDLL